MPEGKRKTEIEDEAPSAAEEAEPLGPEPAQDPAAEEAAAEAAAAPRDKAARLEAEVATLKDQLLRALAETENLRRRHQRERADLAKYAAAPVIKDIVGVSDNLHRAMASVPAEAIDQDPHLKTLIQGLELTEKELAAVFEKHDIVKIDPQGEPLDPHFHEAMFEVPDPSVPSGTVVQVVQTGYRLHDRLLRPARVGVAKGGPAPAKSGKTAPEQAEAAQGKADKANGGGSGEGGNGSTPGSTIDTSV